MDVVRGTLSIFLALALAPGANGAFAEHGGGAAARTRAPGREIIRTGPIDVFGNSKIRTSVILREIPLKRGDPFSYSRLQQGRHNLRRVAGIDYSEIRVAYQTSDSSLGLRVFVTEKPTVSGNVWLQRGYEDELSIGMRAVESSFLGTGQKLEVATVFINNTVLRVAWENPWVGSGRVGLGVRGDYRSYRYVYDDVGGAFLGGRVSRVGGALQVYRTFGEQSRAYLELGYESVDGDRDGLTIDPSGDRYALVELGAVSDRRSSESFPFSGTYVHVLGRLVGPFEDRYSIGEGEADVRAFYPLAGRVVLGAHAAVELADGRNLPVHRRRHVGGGQTLRGWDYGSFHGNNALSAGAELRLPLNFSRSRPLEDVLLGLELHLFGDLGGAWERAADFGEEAVFGGAGLGLAILNRQIRGLRFDYGWRRGGDGRFDFEIGLKF